jgi:hypothetical protein
MEYRRILGVAHCRSSLLGNILKFEGIIYARWLAVQAAQVSAADDLHFYLVHLDILHNISAYEPHDHQSH